MECYQCLDPHFGDDDETVTPDQTPNPNQCEGIPGDIPAYCQSYFSNSAGMDCGRIKQIWDRNMQRVEAHNVRRQNHVDTNSVTADLWMACEATVYAEYLLQLGALQHADDEDRRFKGENLAYKMDSGLTADNYVPEE